METINQQPQHPLQPKTPEQIKQETFSEVLGSIFYRVGMDAEPETFSGNRGERKFPIKNREDAMVALAQKYLSESTSVYNDYVKK